MVALAKRYDVLVVHDLAYADIVYDGWKAPSIMQVPVPAMWRLSFSPCRKATTWRAGELVLCGNKTLVSALARIKATMTMAPYAVTGRGYRGAGRGSAVRARYCRSVQTPP
ncbi:MAG: hypothetical protein ACLTXH_06555 [Enterobacter hormaechei]